MAFSFENFTSERSFSLADPLPSGKPHGFPENPAPSFIHVRASHDLYDDSGIVQYCGQYFCSPFEPGSPDSGVFGVSPAKPDPVGGSGPGRGPQRPASPGAWAPAAQRKPAAPLSTGCCVRGVHSILFVLVGLFLSEPFLRLFTQDETVLALGMEYALIVVPLSFGSLFHICVEKMFQATGNMVIPMFLQGIGAVINLILDPIFIFGWMGIPAMGVAGAAVATVTGQMAACACAILLFIKTNREIPITLKGFRLEGKVLGQLYSIAVPSTLMMAMPSFLVSLLNMVLARFSEAAVNVLGIYFKIQSFTYMPSSGLIQGMRPIMSFNYGAGRRDRMKETFVRSLQLVFLIMAVGMLLFLAIPGPILSMFAADQVLLEIGVPALRMISVSFFAFQPGGGDLRGI